MPGDNENHRNISHHGIKTSQGFAAHVDASAGSHMPEGLCSMMPFDADPHRAGFKMPVGATPSAARPKDEPREMAGPHNQGPHDHLHPMPHQLTPRHTR
jgi:hypothetical protein